MGDTLPGTINEKSSLIRMIFAPTLSALILASFSSFAVAQNATARGNEINIIITIP